MSSFGRFNAAVFHSTLAAVLILSITSVVRAQARSDATGVIDGTVSTENGTVKLPGAVIVVRSASGQQVAQQMSDSDGRFSVANLEPARYTVSVTMDGFQTADSSVVATAGAAASLVIELRIANFQERVDVTAQSPVSATGSLAATTTVTNAETQLLAPGEGFQSAVRLTPGVIQLGNGDSIDGGRPNQASVQLGAATLIDPATNLARVALPADGIDSVSVLPSPYEAEFGRFSSGLVMIQTRRAGDQWKVHLYDLEPALRLKRFTVLHVTGITAWKPSVEIGGPIVKGRVFIEQTAQYHYQTTDIPSRPETELRKTEWVSSFTRIDANLTPKHSLVFSGGFEPSTVTLATLGTFTPPAATADTSDQVGHTMITERALLSHDAVVETTVQFHGYQTSAHGQGPLPMQLLPETTLGHFFNIQNRSTSSFQWIETVSGSQHAPGGLHLFKVGFDLLHTGYEGTSLSHPVLIDRSDGTLARRLDYDGPTIQSVHGSDVAVFAQDRVQPNSRAYIEFGARVDHDGVTDHAGFAPRLGAAVFLNNSATSILRGGYGIFYERTPSVAGAFEQFESATDTRFDAQGTPITVPIVYRHETAGDLEPARSTAWDVGYDNRFNRFVAIHLGLLDRQGSHEPVVDPVRHEDSAALVLASSGRSSYLQEEASVQLTRGSAVEFNTSYVHSSAREDLNALIDFFDVVLQPIVGANEYAPGAADAPNRLFVRGRVMPTDRWLLVGTLDWRSGLPYSFVDEMLEFAGPRNQERFPTYFRLDAGFDRRLAFGKIHPWLGLRVANALNGFLPADVQANTSSPAFGSFYNSVYREYRIHVMFGK